MNDRASDKTNERTQSRCQQVVENIFGWLHTGWTSCAALKPLLWIQWFAIFVAAAVDDTKWIQKIHSFRCWAPMQNFGGVALQHLPAFTPSGLRGPWGGWERGWYEPYSNEFLFVAERNCNRSTGQHQPTIFNEWAQSSYGSGRLARLVECWGHGIEWWMCRRLLDLDVFAGVIPPRDELLQDPKRIFVSAAKVAWMVGGRSTLP